MLFVHAHPDDETISTGGTLATLVDRGALVTVITCTRGECGEVIPPDLHHLVDDQEALAVHRVSELGEAMRILGVTDHRWLGEGSARIAGREPRRYRDSGMVWGASGPELADQLPADALCAADLGEIAADIATVIASTGAEAVVSYDATGGYGHPDHIQAHRAARHAAAVMGVPFFAIEPDATDHSVGLSVNIAPVLDRKVAALRSYRSQLTVDGDRMVMPGGQVEGIGRVEGFRRVEYQRLRGLDWAGRGIPFRLVACLVALGAGAGIGALGTINHQATIPAFGVAIPAGLVGALVVVAAMLVGLRLLSDNRLLPGAAAVGILGSIALLSLESAGGSVLVPATPLAYYWIYGPVLIVLLTLAWPRFASPARSNIGATPAPKGITAP